MKHISNKPSLFYANLRPILAYCLIMIFIACCLLEAVFYAHLPSQIDFHIARQEMILRIISYGILTLVAGFIAMHFRNKAQNRCESEIDRFCDFLCEHIEHSRPFTKIAPLGFSELDLIAARVNEVLARKQKSEYFGQFGVGNGKYFCLQLDEISGSVKEDFCVAFIKINNLESIFKILPSNKHTEFSYTVANRLKAFSNSLSCAQLGRLNDGSFLLGFACKCELKETALSLYLGLKTCFDALLDSDYQIKFSLGIDRLGDSTAQSIANAQKACLHTKEGFMLYSVEMDHELAVEQRLCHELAGAIANSQLQVQYQPKINSKSKVMGAEALVRWRRNDGFYNTEAFVRLAENNGLIIQLERQVITKVCADMARLASMELSTNVSINISAPHFERDDFVEFLEKQLNIYGLNPHNFELEITERHKVESTARKNISKLIAMGFSISLDDFGKDYNSLNQLSELPVSVVKIDKLFVDGLDPNASNHEISVKVVKGIINMAKDLGKQVIAEGVESAEQIEILKTLGCDGYQGFYHYRSLDFDEFSRVLLLEKV